MQTDAIRVQGVIDKIDYSQQRYEEIVEAINGTYIADLPLPKYIGLKTEGLLADLVECFDHLAKDLIECLLLPKSSEKTKRLYEKGKLNVYFPFHSAQLSNNSDKLVFHEFKLLQPEIFKELTAFVDAIDRRLFFVNTIVSARILKDAKELVNEKKHSRVIVVNKIDEGRVFIQGGSGNNPFSVSFDPVNKDGSSNDLRVLNATSSKTIPTYKFSNGQEVTLFCCYALLATRTMMKLFYTKFFNESYGLALMPERPLITFSRTPPENMDGIALIELPN